jgi:hypothetical protein
MIDGLPRADDGPMIVRGVDLGGEYGSPKQRLSKYRWLLTDVACAGSLQEISYAWEGRPSVGLRSHSHVNRSYR